MLRFSSAARAFITLLLLSCAGGPAGGQSRPPASVGHALIWHDSLRMVVLLNTGLGTMNDAQRAGEAVRLWGFDGSRWVLIDSGGPQIRNLGGVAYDSARNSIVIYGGLSATGQSLGDLWEWRGGWTRKTPAGLTPGPRDHVRIAYDRARQRVVLFGGQARRDSFPRDTWEWDGAAWTRVTGVGPPMRAHYVMDWDPAAQRVVVAGGVQPGSGHMSDTWEWDGAAWQQRPGLGAPRTHAAMAYHAGLGGLLLGGGINGGASGQVRTAGTWQPRALDAAMSRYLPAFAYDHQRGTMVVFGGGDASSDRPLDDTWLFSGTTWTRVP